MWKLGKDSWKKYTLKDVCCYAEGKVGNILSWQRFMIAFSSVLLMLGLWFPWNVLALDVYEAFPQIFFSSSQIWFVSQMFSDRLLLKSVYKN